MGNFFDNVTDWMNESLLSSQEAREKFIYTQYAVDTPLRRRTAGSSKSEQFTDISRLTLESRNVLFNEIDRIKEHWISQKIKSSIISDGFNDLNNPYCIRIAYDDPNNPEVSKLFTKDIEKVNKKLKFLNVLKDCVYSEGLDYGEIFLSAKFECGRGAVDIADNLDVRDCLAIYKNTELVGVLKFVMSDDCKFKEHPKFLEPDKVLHFQLNYKKIPIKLSNKFREIEQIKEKIRIAKPLLADVRFLINQYSVLDALSLATELDKAAQGITLQVSIDSEQDASVASNIVQNHSIALNESRNIIAENLYDLRVEDLVGIMHQINVIGVDGENGTNSLKQVPIDIPDGNLMDKLIQVRKNIASAASIPEQYLAQPKSGLADSKEDTLLTNPAYSKLLATTQSMLIKGMKDFYVKHLEYKYRQEGSATSSKYVDRDFIDIQFESSTNLNDRLEAEQTMLKIENLEGIVSALDAIASSPNFNFVVEDEEFYELWRKWNYKTPEIAKSLRRMTPQEIESQQPQGLDMDGQDNASSTEKDNKPDSKSSSTDKASPTNKDSDDLPTPNKVETADAESSNGENIQNIFK